MKQLILTGVILAMGLGASAQWSADPDLNTDAAYPRQRVYDFNYGINPDNSITTVFLSPNPPAKIEMWYNIHDTEGKSKYEDGAQLLASHPSLRFTMFNAISYQDSKKNMLVIHQTKRIASEQGVEGDHLNYDVYKLSPAGELLWDEPVDLNRDNYSEDAQGSVSVAELTDGSYIFAYTDYYYVDGAAMGRIIIERVSEDGDLLWDEPIVMEDSSVSYTYPYMVNSTDNQAIMMYAKGTNQDLMMRKIDFDGTSVWGEDVTVYRGGFPSIPIWSFISIIPDGEGGAIVGWRDDRYFTNYEKTYVSHILSDGTYAYASGIDGERVGYNDTMRSFEPTMLYDEQKKCLYTLYRETNASQSSQRLMIQKMSESGELLWDSYGVELLPDDGSALAFFDLEFAEDGNIVAFYMAQVSNTDVAVYAIKFSAETGDIIWEEPVLLSPDETMRSDIKVTELIDGKYWVAMWLDKRVLATDDVENVDVTEYPQRLYMQRLNVDGTLGDSSSVELVAEEKADVRVSGDAIIAPEGAEVYSLDGVRRGCNGLEAGIYVVRCGGRAVKVAVK